MILAAGGPFRLVFAYLGVWPGWVILVGLVFLAFGLVGRTNSESLAQLARALRSPLMSRESAERFYSPDRAKLFATVALAFGVIIVTFGAVITVAYYLS